MRRPDIHPARDARVGRTPVLWTMGTHSDARVRPRCRLDCPAVSCVLVNWNNGLNFDVTVLTINDLDMVDIESLGGVRAVLADCMPLPPDASAPGGSSGC